MTNWPVHAAIDGPIVMIGFGSIGKGTLPLIERHFSYDKSRLVVIDPDDGDREILDARGVRFIHQAVTRENYRDLLVPLLTAGGGRGFCVNLSVDTSSVAIMELAREIGAFYIDTVIEPWPGFYFDRNLGSEARTNYALRESLLAARRRNPGGITAVSCCGANPGMVSWFVKQALLDIARDLGVKTAEPNTREEWGRLAMTLGVKGIHIAERDTQRARNPKPADVFVNTWSVEGFLSEGMQPAELGWGTHETWMPDNARTHTKGCEAAIYILQPGANTRVRSWTPTPRAQYGFLVTHNESISIADYFTVREGGKEGGQEGERRSTGRPATTPIIPATTPCCRCTRCSAAPGRCRTSTTSSTSTRSSTGSTNSASSSTATPRTPIGTAPSSRWRRRAGSRPTRTPPACRSPPPCWRGWYGRWRTPTPASSRPTRWTSGAASKSSAPISAR